MADIELVHICPFCGTHNTRITEMDMVADAVEPPVGICWSCRGVMVIDLGGRAVRKPTPEELVEIMADARVHHAQGVLGLAKDPYDAVKMLRGR